MCRITVKIVKEGFSPYQIKINSDLNIEIIDAPAMGVGSRIAGLPVWVLMGIPM